MSVLGVLGLAARNINSIAQAARNVGKLADDVQARREAAAEAIGPAQKVAAVQREFDAFRLTVVERLRFGGSTVIEICNVTDLSQLEVQRMLKALDKLKKLTTKPEEAGDEENVAF